MLTPDTSVAANPLSAVKTRIDVSMVFAIFDGREMHIRLTSLRFVTVLMMLASGCATVLRGPKEQVQVQSIPQGASVWIDGVYQGVTPISVTLNRGEDHTVKLAAEGHEELVFVTDSELSGGYLFLDIIAGGGLWAIVDMLTGALYNADLNPLQVILSPKGQECFAGTCTYLQASPTPTEGQQ